MRRTLSLASALVLSVALAGACSRDRGPTGPDAAFSPGALAPALSASANVSGTVGEIVDGAASSPGYYLRYAGDPAPAGYTHIYQWQNPLLVTASPEDGPVVLEGTIDLSGQDVGDISFIGLLDPDFLAAGHTGWGTGAYIYVYHKNATTWNIGPSDGCGPGGECVQRYAAIAAADLPPDGVLHVRFIVDGTVDPTSCTGTASEAGCMTLELTGGAVSKVITDSYGSFSSSPEFGNGGVPGWDHYPYATTGVTYDLTVSPLDVAPGSGKGHADGEFTNAEAGFDDSIDLPGTRTRFHMDVDGTKDHQKAHVTFENKDGTKNRFEAKDADVTLFDVDVPGAMICAQGMGELNKTPGWAFEACAASDDPGHSYIRIWDPSGGSFDAPTFVWEGDLDKGHVHAKIGAKGHGEIEDGSTTKFDFDLKLEAGKDGKARVKVENKSEGLKFEADAGITTIEIHGSTAHAAGTGEMNHESGWSFDMTASAGDPGEFDIELTGPGAEHYHFHGAVSKGKIEIKH